MSARWSVWVESVERWYDTESEHDTALDACIEVLDQLGTSALFDDDMVFCRAVKGTLSSLVGVPLPTLALGAPLGEEVVLKATVTITWSEL